jgi:hypothetical protein
LVAWAEEHANVNGDLLEQVNNVMFDPRYYERYALSSAKSCGDKRSELPAAVLDTAPAFSGSAAH